MVLKKGLKFVTSRCRGSISNMSCIRTLLKNVEGDTWLHGKLIKKLNIWADNVASHKVRSFKKFVWYRTMYYISPKILPLKFKMKRVCLILEAGKEV